MNHPIYIYTMVFISCIEDISIRLYCNIIMNNNRYIVVDYYCSMYLYAMVYYYIIVIIVIYAHSAPRS